MGLRARACPAQHECIKHTMTVAALSGVLLAPLLPLPEAAPLGVDGARSTAALEEARAASPEALSTAAAAGDDAALASR